MREIKETAAERIRRMEAAMDTLKSAWARKGEAAFADPAAGECLRQLEEYMDSGQWLRDYELDEAGALPSELKRGVLSQDGLYDLLTEIQSADLLES